MYCFAKLHHGQTVPSSANWCLHLHARNRSWPVLSSPPPVDPDVQHHPPLYLLSLHSVWTAAAVMVKTAKPSHHHPALPRISSTTQQTQTTNKQQTNNATSATSPTTNANPAGHHQRPSATGHHRPPRCCTLFPTLSESCNICRIGLDWIGWVQVETARLCDPAGQALLSPKWFWCALTPT